MFVDLFPGYMCQTDRASSASAPCDALGSLCVLRTRLGKFGVDHHCQKQKLIKKYNVIVQCSFTVCFVLLLY